MGCMSNTIDQHSSLKSRQLKLSNYTLIFQQRIASGAYGDIWKCKDIKTAQLFAAKQIKFQTHQLETMYLKQVEWLNKLSSVPGVIKIVGNKDITYSKDLRGGVIVSQLYDISLFDLLKNKKFHPEQIIKFIRQMLQTLKALHQIRCLHLDLKLQNILCEIIDKGSILYYICDFGSCWPSQISVQKMQRRQKAKLKQFFEANSTLIYRAPEMVELNKLPITGKADLWMLGCVVYMLVYRKHPFEGQGQLGIMTANINYDSEIQLAGGIGKQNRQVKIIIQCIRSMLQIKLQDRLNEDQLLDLINI